jgi:hypothetical protein
MTNICLVEDLQYRNEAFPLKKRIDDTEEKFPERLEVVSKGLFSVIARREVIQNVDLYWIVSSLRTF